MCQGRPGVRLLWSCYGHQRGSRCASAGHVSGYFGVALQIKDYDDELTSIVLGNCNSVNMSILDLRTLIWEDAHKHQR